MNIKTAMNKNGIAGILYLTIAPVIGVVSPMTTNNIIQKERQKATKSQSFTSNALRYTSAIMRIAINIIFSRNAGTKRMLLTSLARAWLKR